MRRNKHCLRKGQGFSKVISLDIFARACGAHRVKIVEFVVGFQPTTNSTIFVQSGPYAGRFAQKGDLRKALPQSENHDLVETITGRDGSRPAASPFAFPRSRLME